MKKFFLIFLLFAVSNGKAQSQVPNSILGKWYMFEVFTDKFYKNFENDSLMIFTVEDQENDSSDLVKNGLDQMFEQLANIYLIIETDSYLTFNTSLMQLNIKKEYFTFHPDRSIITFGDSNKLDSLKLTPDGLLVYDLSDEYEKQILHFKRKIN